MRNKALRSVLGLAAVVIAVLACTAGAAYAAPATADLNLSISSPGNMGWDFGNHNSTLTWFNQDVSIDDTPTMSTESTTDIPLSYFAYQFNGGTLTSITANPMRTFSAEGIYSFEATGSDLLATAYESSATLGIDKTRPTSVSDVVPVYDGSAAITIEATDTLSGLEDTVYILDGTPEFATPPPFPPDAVSAVVNVATDGQHTLSWYAVDNAGNHERMHTSTFRVNEIGYTPVLGRPSVSVKRVRNVTFSGSVTPATTAKTVWLTVQRLNGRTFRPFATYSVRVPRYASQYSIRKHFTRAGTYRVRAFEDTGASTWSRSFKL